MQKYRPNAAIIVTDGNGHVLMCERMDLKYEGTWQTPQGGIGPGETPRQAAERELMEELGIARDDFEILQESSKRYPYNWTEAYLKEVPFSGFVGQEQQFFLAKVRPGVAFHLSAHDHQEFRQVKWGSPADLIANCWEGKRPGIQGAMEEFGLLKVDQSGE